MKDTDVFDGKKLSDILKDVHDNSLNKRDEIGKLVTQLVGMIKTPDDAQILLPLIKDFYDVSIKNDEQVVKVATIVQRLISAESYSDGSDGGVLLSESEKERLIANALSDMNAEIKEIDDVVNSTADKINGIS